jgi:biopolymer transport protein ExbD
MAMNMGSGGDEDEVVSYINTTPLVDVMLVLLIIFLITIPVVRHSINVQLPNETNEARESKLDNVEVSVSADGSIYWNELRMANSQQLVERLKTIAAKKPQPEVHIRGDKNANYEGVGRVVYACQMAGIAKVGFITEPPARN